MSIPRDTLAGPALASRIAIVYAAIFSGYGLAMGYLNLWFASRGLTLSEIATIASVAPIARMLAGPAVSFVADRLDAHRQIFITLCWASLAAWWLLLSAGSFWTVMFGHILVSAIGAPFMPLIETLTLAGVRASGIDYGRVRSWGSMSFIVASLIGGWCVDWKGIGAVAWLLLGTSAVVVLSAQLLPKPDATTDATTRQPLSVADAMALVRSPPFTLFLIAAGAGQASHAVLYAFGVIHWQSLGYSNGWCGAFWALSVTAEVVLFRYAARWSARFGAHFGAISFLGLGIGTALVRWLVMAFDPPLPLLIILQVSHALTYAAMHIGAMQFIAKTVPDGQMGTAQSLYSLVAGGLGMALAMHFGGSAYAAYGARGYLAMAVLAAIAAVAIVALNRIWTGEKAEA